VIRNVSHSHHLMDVSHCCRNECNAGAAIWEMDSFTWKLFRCGLLNVFHVHQNCLSIYSTLPKLEVLTALLMIQVFWVMMQC